MAQKVNKTKYIFVELAHHLPYSIFGVLSAIILMGILSFLATILRSEQLLPEASSELFHIFHPCHVLVSAVATTAMFWKHDNQSVLKAAIVGLLGSVAICGMSDMVVPHIGGLILGHKMHLHICVIEEPQLVIPFAVMGVLSGFMVANRMEKSTQYSHSVHVFLSSMASLLYLISYGWIDWTHSVATVFFVTIVAVMFPCCLSDIVFPLACTHKYCCHDSKDSSR